MHGTCLTAFNTELLKVNCNSISDSPEPNSKNTFS